MHLNKTENTEEKGFENTEDKGLKKNLVLKGRLLLVRGSSELATKDLLPLSQSPKIRNVHLALFCYVKLMLCDATVIHHLMLKLLDFFLKHHKKQFI